MKYRTADLEGALLDAAVAKCTGDKWRTDADLDDTVRFRPSTSWALGGQILERERIAVEWRDRKEMWNNEPVSGARWLATIPGGTPTELGPTPLIAAMRAFCASRFGEEVELP